jgi:hypothetical protein
LGFRRNSLEGDGQPKKFAEMPKLREKVLASDLQERDGSPMKISAIIGIVVIMIGGRV